VAARVRRNGVPGFGDSNDRVMADDEWEFCRAVEEFRGRTHIRYPTLSQYLHVLKGLGYHKPGA
jgi:hypothetical protein